MSRRIDMTGKKYGRLTAIAPTDRRVCNQLVWKFVCDCGKELEADGHSVRKGNTASCGCLQKERTSAASAIHKMSGTNIHRLWKDMRKRCYSKGSARYKDYGGRGIVVCERWGSFENFYADMGDRPEGASLDRIDNDGPYSPENCRWASVKEQNNNTRQNRVLTYGDERLTVAQWAEKAGIPYGTFISRLARGIPFPYCLLNLNLNMLRGRFA